MKNRALVTFNGPYKSKIPDCDNDHRMYYICDRYNFSGIFFFLKAQKISDLRYVNTRGPAYKVAYRTGGFTIK